MRLETNSNLIKKINLNELFSIVLLFLGKAGGVLVGVFFLPLFSKYLGVEQFSILVVILSLQALLVMLDFGTSTIVGREIAIKKNEIDGYETYMHSIALVSLIYFLLAIVLLCIFYLFSDRFLYGIEFYLLVIVFLWGSVLQNIMAAALISLRKYSISGVVQTVAVTLKAIFVLLALIYIDPSLYVFLVISSILGVTHILFLHYFCMKELSIHKEARFSLSLRGLKKVAHTGFPLLFFGMAGAIAMQSDKLIIANYLEPKVVASYFFAMTFCMTPLAVLAGPIAQYFQPKLFDTLHNSSLEHSIGVIARFVKVLIFVTLLVSIVLFAAKSFLLAFWLRDFPYKDAVIENIKVLMPGLVIGALGYIPFSLLTALKDFKFQAALSSFLTIGLVISLCISAHYQNVVAVCYSCAAYHSLSTILSWCRSYNLNASKDLALKSASLSVLPLLIFLTIYMFIFNK